MKLSAAYLGLLAAAAAAVIAGCGSSPHQMEGKRYAEDGYMGITNTNPNFPMNPAYHNYSKDRQMMRRALKELGVDKQSTIRIRGATAIVTIRLGQSEPAQRDEMRRKAFSMLKGYVPRYDYKIQIE